MEQTELKPEFSFHEPASGTNESAAITHSEIVRELLSEEVQIIYNLGEKGCDYQLETQFIGDKVLHVVKDETDTGTDSVADTQCIAEVAGFAETREIKNGFLHNLGQVAVNVIKNTKQALKPTRKKVALFTIAAMGTSIASEAIGVNMADAQLAKIGSQDVPLPDPDVIQAPWNHNILIATGTSDYGQKNFLANGTFGPSPAAIPILESTDGGIQWKFENYVFSNGQHPAQAESPLGNWPGPRYWAPALRYDSVTKEFNIYFATGINSGTAGWIKKHYSENTKPGEMAIFVAWSKDPFHWNSKNSKLLRFRGQFNDVAGNAKELWGGLIDPTVEEDLKTGQLILGYTVQPNQTFIEQLSPDGLHVYKQVRRISYADLPWEAGSEEGGVLFWNKQAGVMQEMLNTASTWGDRGNDYKQKFIASADPLNGPWVEYTKPILTDGNGLFDPGLGSKPITLSDGKTYIFCHVLKRPRDHESQDRILDRLKYSFDSTYKLYLPDGISNPQSTVSEKGIYYYDKDTKTFITAQKYVQLAQAANNQLKPREQYIQISVPKIGNNGKP